jgi:hypothetical protein
MKPTATRTQLTVAVVTVTLPGNKHSDDKFSENHHLNMGVDHNTRQLKNSDM